MSNQTNNIAEDEIDLVELVKTVWAGRILIIKITSVFVLLGLIIAFTSNVEYTASCTLLPESQEGLKPNLGGLSSLAGIAGINLNLGTSNGLSPSLYPEIVKSLPNQLIIIRDTLNFPTKEMKTSSLDFFLNYDKPSLIEYIGIYTIGLPRMIKSWFFPVSSTNTLPNELMYYHFSKEEWRILENFKERIGVFMDIESGIISISVQMPDPIAAAQLTDKVVSVMTKEVVKYKTSKIKTNLEFIQNVYTEAENRYQKVQKKLAIATDRNKHINSASAKIGLQILQNEYNLSFEVFKGLANQLEQAKISLKESTPVFTIIEPIKIPIERSTPRRGIILFSFLIMGVFVSVLYLFTKDIVRGILKNDGLH